MVDENKKSYDSMEVRIPDIGGATDVDVIDIMVKPGDQIEKDQSLITLEGDKATMDIPSPLAGEVESIALKLGDKVSQDTLILNVLVSKKAEKTPVPQAVEETLSTSKPEENVAGRKASEEIAAIKDVTVPDIGGATDVDVIDIMVKPGDSVEMDQSLITLEGDKATMDIPSPFAGVIESIQLKTGDKVSKGSPILRIKTTSVAVQAEISQPLQTEKPSLPIASSEPETAKTLSSPTDSSAAGISASPAVRRMARELGVNLSEVSGHGRKSRITKEDIQSHVKKRLSEKAPAGGFSLPQAPVVDFKRFGETEVQPLNKIKRLTGVNVHRSWISIPHVTQFDEADITELETFRRAESEAASKAGYKLTMLAFVIKVVYKALCQYPQFNASLDEKAENLIYKKYFNIGIAVGTPNGLVVPVIKAVDKLSISEIALEMGRLSKLARDRALSPSDMSGGCFTVSSLGGIGGTAFTPIVNAPEVAILGLSRSVMKPVYLENEFKPRLMLPLSLSYDHRVIDGAEAARFTRFIAEQLGDIRRILL